MKHGRVQAKDLPDDDTLAAVRACQGMNGVPHWSSLWDVERALPEWPAKVVRAKLAGLIRRGLLRGCACGCRGDFEFPAAQVKP